MTRETRSLPVVAAGAADTPFAIVGYDEVVTCDTTWGEHSHSFHELLWNERGASTAVVGARVWTITPTLGLWMPAGTLHSGSAVAGTWFRASFFGFHATPSISDTPVAVEVTPLLRLLLERLDDRQLSSASRATTEAMVLDVLEPSPRELLVHAPTSALLRPIAEALREDPGDPRTLEDWAAELGVSSRTVTRAFHAETGTSFARWVASVRPSTPWRCSLRAGRRRRSRRRSATGRRAPSVPLSGGLPGLRRAHSGRCRAGSPLLPGPVLPAPAAHTSGQACPDRYMMCLIRSIATWIYLLYGAVKARLT